MSSSICLQSALNLPSINLPSPTCPRQPAFRQSALANLPFVNLSSPICPRQPALANQPSPPALNPKSALLKSALANLPSTCPPSTTGNPLSSSTLNILLLESPFFNLSLMIHPYPLSLLTVFRLPSSVFRLPSVIHRPPSELKPFSSRS